MGRARDQTAPQAAGSGGRGAARDGTLTLLFTDVEESTALGSQLGDVAYRDLLDQHYAGLRRAIATHGGSEVADRGDGLLVVFASARAAIDCALDMQRSAATGILPLKIGINSGEMIGSGSGDYYGMAANLGARLVDVACGGEIVVSSITWGLTRAAGDLRFSAPRLAALKGIPDPEEVRSVLWQDEDADPLGIPDRPGALRLPLPSLVNEAGVFPFVGRESAWNVLEEA